MKIISSIKRFGITIGVFEKHYYNEISKTSECNLPFILARFYSYHNEFGEEFSCGFQVLGRFFDVDDAKKIYEDKSNYLQ